jgi:hypothetical protein
MKSRWELHVDCTSKGGNRGGPNNASAKKEKKACEFSSSHNQAADNLKLTKTRMKNIRNQKLHIKVATHHWV